MDEASPRGPGGSPEDRDAMMDTDPSSLLEHNLLEQQLQEPDAIMEPDVLKQAWKFIEAGGQPAQVLSYLQDGYIGYAAMASIMCSWLQHADRYGGGPTEFFRARQGHPSLPSPGPPGRDDGHGPLGAYGALEHHHHHHHHHAGHGAGAPLTSPDEFSLLSELLLERFDGLKFLAAYTGGRPAFIDSLLADRRGRQLIYDLCRRHEHTALLNYAIQKIVARGLSEEVAAAGVSLSGYFSVFHQTLVNRLARVNAASSPQQVQRLSQEVQDACLGCEHTYLHARLLLQGLEEAEAVDALQQVAAGRAVVGPPGVYRRVAQDLDEALIRNGSAVKAWALQAALLPAASSAEHRTAVHLLVQLMGACHTWGRAPAARVDTAGSRAWGPARLGALAEPRHAQMLQQLLRIYQQQQQQQQQQAPAARQAQDAPGAVPLQPLRQKYALDMMLAGVFSGIAPGSPGLPPAVVDACKQLLAFAVTADELWRLVPPDVPPLPPAAAAGQPAGRRAPTPSSPRASCGAAPEAPEQQPPAAAAAAARPSRLLVGLDTSSVAEAARVLGHAQQLAGSILSGAPLGDEVEEQLQRACELKAAALGLVRLTQAVLGDREHYQDDKCRLSFPGFLALLQTVGLQQPALVPQVLACCYEALTALGRERAELAAQVVDLLVTLLLAGHTEGVCGTLRSWAEQGADPSLLRQFVVKVVDVVGAPFAPEFARAMLWLMLRSNIDRSITPDNKRAFWEFADSCFDVNFAVPLQEEEMLLLDRLRN